MLKKERLSFTVETAQPERFLNLLKERRIACTNIIFKNYLLSGTTSVMNKKGLTEICRKERAALKFNESGGFCFKVIRYKKRFGILIGRVLCFVLCFIMSNFVFYIEVTGNKEISKEKIIYSLRENGISPGKFIPDMDFLNAERTIAQQYEQIAWITIRSSGGRIVADIDETEPPPSVLPENAPCNIVASRDAQITGVRVLNGILVPLVGDAVCKGDLLVSGTMENLHGETRIIRALGSIKGQYQEKEVFLQPLHTIEKLPTGEMIKKRRFTMLSFSIPLDLKRAPEEDFTFTTVFQPVSLFSIKLPFGITTDKYYLYDSEEVFYSEEEGRQMLKNKMCEYEKIFLADEEIIRREIQENIASETISYTVLYTLEGEIGKNEAIIVKN